MTSCAIRFFAILSERCLANDWALPLSDSELQPLKVPAYRLWDRVVEELELRLSAAA